MNPQQAGVNLQGSNPYLQGGSLSVQPAYGGNLQSGNTSSVSLGQWGNPTIAPWASSAQPPVHDATPTNNVGNNTGGGGTGGGGTNPTLVNAINTNYGQQQRGFQDQINMLSPAYSDNQTNIAGQYGAQHDTLQHQYEGGLASQDLAQNQLEQSRARTFRDLTHQMSGAVSGYNNQLGTFGAGDSSASGLINYALTQQGNRQIGDLNQQVGNQQQGLQLQGHQLQVQYTGQVANLDQWKNQALSTLGQQYASTMTQLQDALSGSQGTQAQTLAMYGQGAAAQDIMNKLSAIDTHVTNARQTLDSAYNSAPNSDLTKYNQFSTTAPTVAGIQGVNLSPVAASQQFDPTAASLQRKSPYQL